MSIITQRVPYYMQGYKKEANAAKIVLLRSPRKFKEVSNYLSLIRDFFS